MKFKEFIGALDKGLKHVYLLSGEEKFYIDKAREEILARLKVGRDDLMTIDAADKVSLDEVIGAIDSAPLFAAKNVVLVKNAPYFSADGKFDRLDKVLGDMLATNYVIFTAKSANKQRRLYKTVVKVGEILEADPLRPWEIDGWLNEKVKSLGKNIRFDAKKYFVEQMGMLPEISLWYMENELNKTALNVSGKEITLADLQRNLSELPEVSNFAILDAIDAKKPKTAVKILRTQQNKFPVVLATLSSHVRKLIRTKFLVKQGVAGAALAKKLEMHPYIMQKFEKTSTTYSAKLLEEIFPEIADADFKMKTGRAGIEILERIVIKLCRRT